MVLTDSYGVYRLRDLDSAESPAPIIGTPSPAVLHPCQPSGCAGLVRFARPDGGPGCLVVGADRGAQTLATLRGGKLAREGRMLRYEDRPSLFGDSAYRVWVRRPDCRCDEKSGDGRACAMPWSEHRPFHAG
jgi:hypothetical protein